MPRVHHFPEEWHRFASANFDLKSSNLRSQSVWNGRQSVYGPHAQLWRGMVTLVTHRAEDHAAISSFYDEIGGSAGLIAMRHPTRTRPLYDVEQNGGSENFSDATNFTDGTGFQTGFLPAIIRAESAAERGERSFIVGGDGMPVSTARVLRKGDVFHIERNGIFEHIPSFHRVSRDAPTNADGETLIEFYPSLRKGVAIGDQIVLRNAKCVFRMIDDDQGEMNIAPPDIGDSGFTLIEALV